MELNRAVNTSRGFSLLVPVWRGRSIEVAFHRWHLTDVTDKQRALLLRYGWPEHMLTSGNWPNWGGVKFKSCTVHTALVENGKKLIPIAQFVAEDTVHNALLQRNLLQGHGFPTDLGWYKMAQKGDVINRQFLKPSSNKLGLPAPVDWSILTL